MDLQNCQIATKYIQNAEKIYGINIGNLTGKMTKTKFNHFLATMITHKNLFTKIAIYYTGC